MLHIQIATSFDSFRDRVYEVRDKRGQCRKIIFRMLHAQLAAAFDLFTESMMVLKAHRQVRFPFRNRK